MDTLTSVKDLLFTLLLKVGVGVFDCGAAGAVEYVPARAFY